MPKSLLIFLALLNVPFSAHALFDIYEGKIKIGTDASIAYDTGVSANSESGSDLTLSLRTLASYSRSSRLVNFRASVGVLVKRYTEFTDFNDESVYFDLSIIPTRRFETSRFSVSSNLILSTNSEADADVGQIVTTRVYGINASAQYRPNRNYSLSVSGSAMRNVPDSEVLDSTDTLSTSLRLTKPVNKDWNSFISASYSKTSSSGGFIDGSYVTSLNGGIGGNIFPKLSGTIALGIQQRNSSTDKTSSPFISGDIGWKINETSTVNLRVNNSFSTTLNDQLSEELSVGLSASRNMNRRMSVNAGVGWSQKTYSSSLASDRSDEEWSANTRLSYTINKWSRLSLSVQYTDRTSGLSLFSYDRYIFTLALAANF